MEFKHSKNQEFTLSHVIISVGPSFHFSFAYVEPFFLLSLPLCFIFLFKLLAQPFQSAVVALLVTVLDLCLFTMPGSILDLPWRIGDVDLIRKLLHICTGQAGQLMTNHYVDMEID